MKRLLIVYHSLTGGTEQLVTAATGGARREAPDVDVRVLTAPQAGPEDVLAADAYVFATPENLAAIAGLMKDFFDRCYYPVLGRIEGRPYATLICAGSDGSNAARQVERICTGWRLKAAAPALNLLHGLKSSFTASVAKRSSVSHLKAQRHASFLVNGCELR